MRKALMLTTVVTGALATALWQPPAPISFAAAERTRLRAHFDSVARALRAQDVPRLPPGRRAAPARRLEILRSSRLRGERPPAPDFPARARPAVRYCGAIGRAP